MSFNDTNLRFQEILEPTSFIDRKMFSFNLAIATVVKMGNRFFSNCEHQG